MNHPPPFNPRPAVPVPADPSGASRSEPGIREPGIRELLAQLWQNLETLVRGEATLLRAEMEKKGRELRARVIAVTIGGGVLLAAAGCLVAAIVLLLAQVMVPWLAALIVGIVFGIVGYALLMRKPSLSDVVPERTLESIQKDVSMLTENKP